jgi:hypothetical protein
LGGVPSLLDHMEWFVEARIMLPSWKMQVSLESWIEVEDLKIDDPSTSLA